MAEPASPGTVEITAGGAGALGAGSVGIDWVAKDGKSAKISLGAVVAGTHWSTRLAVHPQSLVQVAGSVFRINAILPASRDKRAHVVFAPVAAGEAAALPADTVVLTAAEPLRLGGPAIEATTALRVTGFRPDDRAPATADIEWWPALHERDDTDPANVGKAQLTSGGRAVVGGTSVAVLGIEGAVKDHPARVLLRLLPPG